MKTIRFERQGSIGHIVLANPPYNRLDLQFSHCLRDAVHEASSSDIRALVISSEGEDFSFGGEASRFAMLGEPISGALAGNLGIATHVVPNSMVEGTAAELAATLANGPTKAYAAVRSLLKAWSAGGVPAADAVMLDITMPLHATEDVTRGFINTAKAFDKNIEPPAMIFHGR